MENAKAAKSAKANLLCGVHGLCGLPLPHPALGLPHHRSARLARERLLEFGHVRDDAVHTIAAGRVRIGLREQALELGPPILAPHLTPPEEEALLGGEAIER